MRNGWTDHHPPGLSLFIYLFLHGVCTLGVDVHQEDSLGKLALTNEGIRARDHFV